MRDYNFKVDVFNAILDDTYFKYVLSYSGLGDVKVYFTDPIGGAEHLIYLANVVNSPFNLEISDKAKKELPHDAIKLLEGIVKLHNNYIGTIESTLATAGKTN